MTQPLILVDQRDNVATALRPLALGQSIQLEVGGKSEIVRAQQAIPFGHKIALTRLEKGDAVFKYGEVIGFATEDIERGEHVHIHNVKGLESRGCPE